ncbi:extracellular solute-binding protein [Eubacterium sp. MSJ-13]|uniref:extracellular solute-binding protein n=1 Tax=Eubacterium sp. MSJ-13 TaxID=2841513 RepID=UPI001C0F5CD8|nr:extracellular solute-binding protein [Eubacterium sp. MSJ-13]MBU5478025.1 extracellular solute-binding protein [Eubacterium sp. MSJ-13]
MFEKKLEKILEHIAVKHATSASCYMFFEPKMPRKLRRGLIINLLMLISVLMCGCSKDVQKQEKILENEAVKNTEKADIEGRLVSASSSDIVWTVSDDVNVNETYLKYFNEKLKKDGYAFQLKFQYLKEDEYDSEIRQVLKNGKTDIALAGQNTDERNYVTELCKDNLLMCLDDKIKKEKSELYGAFEDPLWKSVEVDGKVYTVPNGIFADGKYCIVFNKDVLGEKADDFDGDILSINRYLSQNKTDSDKLLFDLSLEDFAGILGGNIDYGIYFDGKKETISSIFENSNIYKLEKMFYDLNKAGQINELCAFNQNEDDQSKIKELIKNKKFAVLLTKRTKMVDSLDGVLVKDLDFTVNFERNGGTTGICEKSKKKENALQLLTLLYTRDDYTRLLLYGKEGKDYTIKNGRIVSDDISYSLVDVLGLFRGSIPTTEETVYYKNIRKQKKQIYSSRNCQTSKFAGFQLDFKNFKNVSSYTDAGEEYYDIWKESTFPDEYENAKKKVAEEQKKLLKEVNRQYENWKKNI